jgi:hypothetical protein
LGKFIGSLKLCILLIAYFVQVEQLADFLQAETKSFPAQYQFESDAVALVKQTMLSGAQWA